MKVNMKKKRMGTRGEMIKVKVNHLKDLVRPRVLREMVAVPTLLVEVLIYAVGVIIGIMRSVGEAAVHAILVDRWGIRLLIDLRISRGPNSFPYHHLCRTSKFQDLVVMPRLDEEVLIIVKAKRLLIPQDSISTLRILIIRVVTLSIREVLCLISHIQSMDPQWY
ncbi:hypothetical protein ACFX1T_037990 [Malus domestica]